MLTWTVRALFGIRLRDSQSGMWALDRSLKGCLARGADDMSYSEEIKIRAFRLGPERAHEEPVTVEPRARLGSSKLRPWRDGLANLEHLFRLRWRGDGDGA